MHTHTSMYTQTPVQRNTGPLGWSMRVIISYTVHFHTYVYA